MRRFGKKGKRVSALQVVAFAMLAVITLMVAASPWFAPLNPLEQDVANRFAPVGDPVYLLGSDVFGRDVLARLMSGLRIELFIAVSAASLAAIVGTLFGLIGGYFGRVAEILTMRTTDIILGFPSLILALLVVTIYGPGSTTLIFAMALVFMPAFARLTYGQVLSVKSAEYVEAAKVFGGTSLYTLFRVVLPNSFAPTIVQFSLAVPAAILLESGLSFLGLGVVPPTPSLGLMIAEGQRYMNSNPEALIVPAALIVFVILAFGVLGEALRDWFDPRR